MFKRIRAKKSSPKEADNPEYKAVMDSLSPHLNATECRRWYERWKTGGDDCEEFPFLRVVTFTNDVCRAHKLDKPTRRAIRDSLCKSLLVDREHHAA